MKIATALGISVHCPCGTDEPGTHNGCGARAGRGTTQRVSKGFPRISAVRRACVRAWVCGSECARRFTTAAEEWVRVESSMHLREELAHAVQARRNRLGPRRRAVPRVRHPTRRKAPWQKRAGACRVKKGNAMRCDASGLRLGGRAGGTAPRLVGCAARAAGRARPMRCGCRRPPAPAAAPNGSLAPLSRGGMANGPVPRCAPCTSRRGRAQCAHCALRGARGTRLWAQAASGAACGGAPLSSAEQYA